MPAQLVNLLLGLLAFALMVPFAVVCAWFEARRRYWALASSGCAGIVVFLVVVAASARWAWVG
jgi:hypothetical protein